MPTVISRHLRKGRPVTSVFLSYDREDADRGRRVARALEKAGHSVWWDRHIRSGAQYSREIDEALQSAEAVVVLWSKKSIDSAWVRDEAAAGRDAGKLVPIRIEEVDPPLGFRQYQTTDLTRWRGRRTPEFEEMLEAIASLSGSSRAPILPTATVPTQPKVWSLGRPLVIFIAAFAMAAIGLLAWKLLRRPSSIPVVEVVANDPSPASQSLARDLLVKLNTLQAARPNTIELLSQGDTARRATLTFQVGRSGADQVAGANLALTDAKNRSLLWAKDFRDPNGSEADLRQQLAYTAAHVLGCALDAMDPAAGRLSRQSLKIYLNACATISDADTAEMAALLPPLHKLVQDAPRFAGGWSKLLLAETAVATDPIRPEAKALRPGLARHIAQARKLHPNLGETYVAEYALTPDPRFLKRSQLLDQGVERNPENPELRYARYVFLQGVGRMDDGLQDARRAMELDPLSPSMREGYILSLAFAGRSDEAFAELDKAEKLWPGATTLQNARYVLDLRIGDPREALGLLREGVMQDAGTDWVRAQEVLLEARVDPSPEHVNAAVQTATTTFNHIPQAISLLSQTLVELDREEELFPILLNWQRMDIVTWATEPLFRPKFSNFHKDPRFMQVAKRLGLLDYWRASGKWPDFCSRGDLPYDCRAEAAKLTT